MIFNLCGHDPPTLQTETDDMRSQGRALRYSASRGNKNCVCNTCKQCFYVLILLENTLFSCSFCWCVKMHVDGFRRHLHRLLACLSSSHL